MQNQSKEKKTAILLYLKDLARVQLQKSKFQIFFPAPAWRLKARQNKKCIATAICKWRDESNEPN